jgi:hypothetical protein
VRFLTVKECSFGMDYFCRGPVKILNVIFQNIYGTFLPVMLRNVFLGTREGIQAFLFLFLMVLGRKVQTYQ